MTGNVVKFYPATAAENPDNVLEQAIGQYESAVIIGYDGEGDIEARASLNLDHKEILWILEMFKADLLSGVYLESDE